VSESELEALYVESECFSLASHLYWGVWALVQVRTMVKIRLLGIQLAVYKASSESFEIQIIKLQLWYEYSFVAGTVDSEFRL
jgi:hypothetical protein